MRALAAAFAEARRGLRLRRRRGAAHGHRESPWPRRCSAPRWSSPSDSAVGFDRAARAADLPDIIVRFDPESERLVDQRISALPDVASYSTRRELLNVGVAANGQRRGDAVGRGDVRLRAHRLRGGRRHGVSPPPGPGRSSSWASRRRGICTLGSTAVRGRAWAPARGGLRRGAGQRRLSRSPSPRIYLSRRALDGAFGPSPNPQVNLAEIWLRDPQLPERGARPGPRDELRPARHPVRHALRGPGAARPGGRDRDRPARRALGDRARDRERDARRLGAGRGPAPARRDRGAPRGRRVARRRSRSPRRLEALLVAAPAAALGLRGRGARHLRARPTDC